MQVKKHQIELDMEQHTGSKSGKEHIKAVYGHPVYLNHMQGTSCKMLGWRKHKLDSRLLGEISEPIIQSEVSQKEKHQYSILTYIYGI